MPDSSGKDGNKEAEDATGRIVVDIVDKDEVVMARTLYMSLKLANIQGS